MRGSTRPEPALSDLSVTEFLTLARIGFFPHGLVIGSSVYDSGFGIYLGATGERTPMSQALREARRLAVSRMRDQAKQVHAEGVVGVRLLVEHHRWRGNHNVVKFIAIGTAIGFDHDHVPAELRGAPSLALYSGMPFTSDLSGQDFVMLLRAGYRPIELAFGSCVYEIDRRQAGIFNMNNEELVDYTAAFFDARETAMKRLTHDIFREFSPNGHDAPVGVVGMTVTETMHGERGFIRQVPVVEFTAVGTAIAHLDERDPRRAPQPPAPQIVVPLDR
jgi:uncharacterized protein YbjQ (UPF0145 family)